MALSKADRISFSQKIINADNEILSIESSKLQITAERNKAFDLDQANKRLVDAKTVLINEYQAEFARYGGVSRTILTELDIQNGANFVLGNFLYPNNPQNPPPSTAPQIWIRPKPYARNLAVGKFYTEVFPAAIAAEQDELTATLAIIAAIEAFPLIQRVTGQVCTNGTCSIPLYTDSISCTTNGGVWTPGLDTIISNTPLQTQQTNLLAALNSLKSYILITQPLIITNDTVTVRQTQNNAAISDINNTVNAIDAWIALTVYNTSHGQTTCTGFNAYNPALLGATRLQSGNLATIKNAILSRQLFVANRLVQLDTNLGSITQDLLTGDYTGSGLYFERWNFVGLRLNLFGGSLLALSGFDRAITAQNALQSQILLGKTTYQTLLTCSILSAPSNGTKVLHIKSIGDLVVGDNIFLVSNSQEELILSISAVDGNRITVGREIPPKYRPADGARVYKDKT